MTPRQFIEKFIREHEGGLSLHAADNGNWFDPVRYAKRLPQRRDAGKLVGSKYGVTAYALADHRGVTNITAADIAGLQLSEAVDIGVEDYYAAGRFDLLCWNRVVAAAVDASYMSGPKMGAKLIQRTLGVPDDGIIGAKVTVPAFAKAVAQLGEDELALRFCAVRKKFYDQLASNEGPNDPDKKFLKGWRNRADSFLPGTSWWKAW